MADRPAGKRSRDEIEQMHRDNAREARVQPGPSNTTNEDDLRRAEGLQVDPETAENHEEALDRGARQAGEGRILNS